MVFKPFTTLARQSISKHLVSGYAQSVVAATQSSYASSTLPLSKLQNNVPIKLHNAFGGAHSGRSVPGKDGQGSDSLSSFYAVSQNVDDKDDKKYLFSAKILWSKAQHQQQQQQLLGPRPLPETIARPRSQSLGSTPKDAENILGTKQPVEEEAVEEPEVEQVEEAVRSEETEVAAKEEAPELAEALAASVPLVPRVSEVTEQYNRELERLREEYRYEEVGAVFQHMVTEGVKPSVDSYNCLLAAIIELRPLHIAQVLDTYKRMLAEGLIPNTSTYTSVIGYLASRAIRSYTVVRSIKRDAERFGIMLPHKNAVAEELQKEGSLDIAMELFYTSLATPDRAFPESFYKTLIQACSKFGREVDMLNVAAHMEKRGVLVDSNLTRSMIRGFGRAGDMRSAIQTYNTWQELAASQDLDSRYRIYRDLISAYMDSGDQVGALDFLERVSEVSQDPSRFEWLTQAIIRGFVEDGDISTARKWATKLSLHHTHSMWLSKLLTKVADKGDLEFARVLYNTISLSNTRAESPMSPSTDIDFQQTRHAFTQSQMSSLALCIRNGDVELARALWADLSLRDSSDGPNITTAVAYTMLLFKHGLFNEGLVVLNQYSTFFLDRYVPYPSESMDPSHELAEKRKGLHESYEHVINELANGGFLNPSIALDIAGFSWNRCNMIGLKSSMLIMAQFDGLRIRGLEPAQLFLLLPFMMELLVLQNHKGLPPHREDALKFGAFVDRAIELMIPPTAYEFGNLTYGASLASQVDPSIGARWESYTRQAMQPPPPPTPLAAVPHASPLEASPTVVYSDASGSPESSIVDEHYDPYWEKIDMHTSQAIDTSLERNKYNKVADLRRMYRTTRRSGKCFQLTTLAKMVTTTSRTNNYEDFVEEIYRNAKIDTPFLPDYYTSKVGWAVLLDALMAAHLNMGHREKAEQCHKELNRMGSSPSANTFGLYIVSLKGSKTHDEASEALDIFLRSRNEGVVPTSFLYNALIGKLAKARRVEECLFYYAEMTALGIKATSVTYGTMINALTRVGDESFAEELFNKMESEPNYKPRPAPYNSLMQFFITTKRDRAKVLSYYNRMLSLDIKPTAHTYKLLIEAYATLDTPDMTAAEKVLDMIVESGEAVETSHHSALIHAKGCVLHDVPAAIEHFNSIVKSGKVLPDSTLYQALLECLVANHRVGETPEWTEDMKKRGITLTPYIANTLIHGWALEKNIVKAKQVYDAVSRKEPSTYEAMTRAYLAVEDRVGAKRIANDMNERGYPHAVYARVADLVKGN